MRLALTPCCDRNPLTAVALRAPSAMLYSRVPRSSAWPSMVTVYCGYWLSQMDCFCRMPCASAVKDELSTSKWTRSPTLEVKSWADPGAALSTEPTPYSLGGNWLFAHAARTKATARTPAIVQARLTPPPNPIFGYSASRILGIVRAKPLTKPYAVSLISGLAGASDTRVERVGP